MEHCDGEIPAKRRKLCDGGGSEDHLSALPDDVLIHILLKILDVAVAARTSVLSSRWRRLWRLLPELNFLSPSDPQHIRLALTAHEAPVLHRLSVDVIDSTAESVAAWLPIAARCLSGNLLLINTARHNETEDEAAEAGALELPCFENATSIHLEPGYLGLAVQPLGEFAGLTDLFLACIKLHGPCKLGEAVSSLRCPSLQRLTVCDAWGMGNFTIQSESLKQLKLINLHELQQLIVMAPALKLLHVASSFARSSSNNQPVANISAPQLVSLVWADHYDPSFTQLGKMENLEWLRTYPFLVYGQGDFAQKLNSSCVRLLRRFELIRSLKLILAYVPDITNTQYLMEDITRLPDLTHLGLHINPQGHSFGASVFHVLRMCTGVRNLVLTFLSATRHPEDITNQEYLMKDSTRFPKVRNLALNIIAKGHSCGPSSYHVLRICTVVRKLYLTLVDEWDSPEAQTVCPSGCVCDQPPNWKTDEFALNCLREVKVRNLRGTENEAGLVKRLFNWATVLETMTVTFHFSVARSKAREFCQMLQSFSRPEICLKGPHFA